MLHLIYQCIIGVIVGAVAKFVMPGKEPPGGILVTMLLGIAGSIVANYLGKMLGFYQSGEAAGFIMSVIGAGILMVIYKFATK